MSKVAEKYGIDLFVEGKIACPKCRAKGGDNSGDNLMVYGHDGMDGHKGAFCWSCSFTIPSTEWLEEHGEVNEEEYEVVGSAFNAEIHQKLKDITTTDGRGFRGISAATTKYFGVLHEINVETNEVAVQYYPCTTADDSGRGFSLTGYKRRKVPKEFAGPIGETGKDCQMFGQFRFLNSNSRKCLIVGGEVDQLSAFQMIKDYYASKGGEYEDIPVVSSTIGESGAHKQVVNQYAWFNRFEQVIICMDNDKAGQEAAEKIAKALPKGKARLMSMSFKDPNEYLEKGRSKEFISAFFNAREYTPSGVVGSGSLMNLIKAAAAVPKIPLPPFMHKVQNMMAGGIPLGTIVNLGSASGCVDKDTEYLTPEGWKKFDQYVVGDKVAQYHEDGSMTFVQPLEYVKKECQYMTHFSNRSTDQVLSDEHRFVYYSQAKGGKPHIKPFAEVKALHEKNVTGFRGHIATTFTYDGVGIDFTEGELRLQVAVMADGRIVKEGKDNYTHMRFNKRRKYTRLMEMVQKFNLRHSDRGMGADGYYEVIVWPKTEDKSFSGEFYRASRDQLEVICDEVMHWDGTLKSNIYTSCRKGDVDFLQFAYAACGKRAVVGEDKRYEKYREGYCGVLSVNKGSQRVSIRRVGGNKKTEMKQYETLDGFKYCFMVETGMLVLRRNGRIFITGNTGKSTIIEECVYYWVFNSPHKVGVVSLESDCAQYGIKLLSRHVGTKLDLIEDNDYKVELLHTQQMEDAAQTLFFNEDGSNRWHLVDDRDGSLDNLKELVMSLIIACDCKVIILDPLQDIMDGLSNEEQAVFMKWMKGTVKSHGVTFVNVNHVRKSATGGKANSAGADLHEEDFQGSSAIFKSAACNLLFTRNKEAECDIERNVTLMKMTKCRWTGNTAPRAGSYFYENKSHLMHDLEDYLNKHPDVMARYMQNQADKED